MPRARLQPALARVRLLRAQVVVVLVGLRPASTLRIAILVALGCSNIVAPVYRWLRRRLDRRPGADTAWRAIHPGLAWCTISVPPATVRVLRIDPAQLRLRVVYDPRCARGGQRRLR